MPIYEYQCSNCHHAFDLIQKMSDEPVKLCPACSKDTAVRLVSAAGFQLKGTGWYETDFKTKNQSEKSASSKTKTVQTSAPADSGSSEKKSTEPTASSNTTKDA